MQGELYIDVRQRNTDTNIIKTQNGRAVPHAHTALEPLQIRAKIAIVVGCATAAMNGSTRAARRAAMATQHRRTAAP